MDWPGSKQGGCQVTWWGVEGLGWPCAPCRVTCFMGLPGLPGGSFSGVIIIPFPPCKGQGLAAVVQAGIKVGLKAVLLRVIVLLLGLGKEDYQYINNKERRTKPPWTPKLQWTHPGACSVHRLLYN